MGVNWVLFLLIYLFPVICVSLVTSGVTIFLFVGVILLGLTGGRLNGCLGVSGLLIVVVGLKPRLAKFLACDVGMVSPGDRVAILVGEPVELTGEPGIGVKQGLGESVLGFFELFKLFCGEILVKWRLGASVIVFFLFFRLSSGEFAVKRGLGAVVSQFFSFFRLSRGEFAVKRGLGSTVSRFFLSFKLPRSEIAVKRELGGAVSPSLSILTFFRGEITVSRGLGGAVTCFCRILGDGFAVSRELGDAVVGF